MTIFCPSDQEELGGRVGSRRRKDSRKASRGGGVGWGRGECVMNAGLEDITLSDL